MTDTENKNINYYISFANYTHGLALHEQLKKAGLQARIAPLPKALQGELNCGMSLLVKPEHIDAIREYIAANGCDYHEILPLAGQISPRRDKFC